VAELGLVVILVDLVVAVLGVTLQMLATESLHQGAELPYRNRTCLLVVCGSWV
jgi:hypothetical protein